MTIGDEKVVDVLAIIRNVSATVLDGEERSCMREDMSKAYDAYASLLEEKNQVAAENERLRAPFTEEQGRELRDFVQPKEDAPTTITFAQWDAICGFVREGDRVEDALRERMLDAESQLAELRGKVTKIADRWDSKNELNGELFAQQLYDTLAAADGGGK